MAEEQAPPSPLPPPPGCDPELDDEWVTVAPPDVDDALRAEIEAALDVAMADLLPDSAPGSALAGLLAIVPVDELGAGGLVDYAAACQRLASWAAEREAAATAALARRCATARGTAPVETDDAIAADRLAAHELGAALSLSAVAAANRVAFAQALDRLPATRLALAAGRIDAVKARAIVDATTVLDDAGAAAVEARVLPRAAEQTAAALRACLRRAVTSTDPAAAQRRHERAVDACGVFREPLPDGMGRLVWESTAEQIESTYLWITGKAELALAADRAARNCAAASDAREVRRIDQARSDVLADLGAQGLAVEDLPTRQGRRPQIRVVVAASTLLGVDEEPAELVGHGPITAPTARRIAAEGTWRRLLTDPVTGELLAMGSTRYEPPDDMREAVVTRDQMCRGLGCRRPADRCDIDHRVQWPIGATRPANLDSLCRSHHRLKTLTDTQTGSLATGTGGAGGGGGLAVTLPSGRRYVRPVEPVLDHPALVRAGPPSPDDPDPPPF